MEPAKVLVVDDHTLFRLGVCAAIERASDLEVVGEAEDGREALVKARELEPDLILMDINMPGGNGLDAVRAIRTESTHVIIIMLTVHDDDEKLLEAIRGGADGFLTKDIRAGVLVASLREAVNGEAVVSKRMIGKVLKEFARLSRIEAGYVAGQLTPRESQVLEQLARGLGNREIGCSLCISENTVKVHITHILKKLHLDNRSQAAAYAKRLELQTDSSSRATVV